MSSPPGHFSGKTDVLHAEHTSILPGISPLVRQGDYVCQIQRGVVGRISVPFLPNSGFGPHRFGPKVCFDDTVEPLTFLQFCQVVIGDVEM